jgi:hypothetical protein
MGLLALLPIAAYAPAWSEGRLLAPGDGTYLHYPLRMAVWDSYARGQWPSWNSAIFSGTSLLAAYRPGACYLPALLLLPLSPFVAFQCLILLSLSATAVLTYLLLRQLGADRVGAYVGGVAFALGPYLVNHLGDSATVIAVPPLLLAVLAAETFVRQRTGRRAAALAGAVALLLTAGSFEAVRAGIILVGGRLLLTRLAQRSPERASLWSSLWPLAAGAALAAPQLFPALLALTAAGHQTVALAEIAPPGLAGGAGLVLRYVSHTPAVALAAAALPLMLRNITARVLGVLAASCLALQWGRGPLTTPGTLALLFDLALALIAGLALSTQWQARRETAGARGRGHFFLAALLCVSLLPISAATAGPLAPRLAPGVGLLTLALILYFRLASHARPLIAASWLVPLTLAFALQPQGRDAWAKAPLREDLAGKSATQEALQERMGRLRDERVLTLTRRWPREASDLAFGNLALTSGIRSANGYDPMVPLATLRALEGLTSSGLVQSGAFYRTDPHRLEALGVRWVQIPTSALTASAAGGETLDVALRGPGARFFAFPTTPTTSVRVVSSLSDAVSVPQGAIVARVVVGLASGRTLAALLRAGEETAEWAYDRADVRPVIRHARARVAESWAAGGFEGHRYAGSLGLPGRYLVNSVTFEGQAGTGELLVTRLALVDDLTPASTPASLVSALVSDTRFFQLALTAPTVWLFELPHALGRARVVERLATFPDEKALQRALETPAAKGLDLARVALATEGETQVLGPLLPGRVSAAHAQVDGGGRIVVDAVGPGVLVVAESWDRGWSARVDGQARPVVRLNQGQMGVALPEGAHTIALDYSPPGLLLGIFVAFGALAALVMVAVRDRAPRETARC